MQCKTMDLCDVGEGKGLKWLMSLEENLLDTEAESLISMETLKAFLLLQLDRRGTDWASPDQTLSKMLVSSRAYQDNSSRADVINLIGTLHSQLEPILSLSMATIEMHASLVQTSVQSPHISQSVSRMTELLEILGVCVPFEPFELEKKLMKRLDAFIVIESFLFDIKKILENSLFDRRIHNALKSLDEVVKSHEKDLDDREKSIFC